MSKRKIFVISDTHFGHNNIVVKFGRRHDFHDINHMNETIIKNWNSVVGKDDKVIHLGDVAHKIHPKDLNDIMNRLNGSKYLILGNHDKVNVLLPYFTTIRSSLQLRDKQLILTHIPIHPASTRGYKNLHGHIHDTSITVSEDHVNVACEFIDYTPVELDQYAKND